LHWSHSVTLHICAVSASISPPNFECLCVSEIFHLVIHCTASSLRDRLRLGVSHGTGLADLKESAEPRLCVDSRPISGRQSISLAHGSARNISLVVSLTHRWVDGCSQYRCHIIEQVSAPYSYCCWCTGLTGGGSALPCRRI